ncbi:MAG: methylenetetrahydrofolate reductase [NAD(P)H] [Eubacteriales bacterium]
MKINEKIKRRQKSYSFEIFPPKGDLSIDTARTVLDGIAPLEPTFISVTYSAGGGGNSHKTVGIADMIKNECRVESMAHLTCINSDIEKVKHDADLLRKAGVENILALRGDKVEGGVETDFHHASDLITYLKRNYDFCLGAACYPEAHPQSETLIDDIENLKKKQDAGADFFVSQLFFDNTYFYNFTDKARACGINVPLCAGVMPILGRSQIERMVYMCCASLPAAIVRLLNKYADDPESLRKAGIEYAAKQCVELVDAGVDDVHIYTMNQPDIAKTIVEYIKSR